jgi:perosamine synthetase
MEKVYYTKPSISELEISYVNDAIRNGWGEKCYDYIKRFESTFAKYLHIEYALATASCSGAIHLALASLGIGEGDEVIVPETTWVATTSPVLYLGAKPVFVDIEPDTWCINPQKIREAITPKTKAIMVVHLYGNIAKMNEIMQIAKEHNLYMIEDAAEALGSIYQGKKVGTIGDIAVFSFHGTKTMTTGEGGMLVTNNPELIGKARMLNDHGRVAGEPKMFFPHHLGYKYKISNLQAALGLAQTERLDELVAHKIWVFQTYKKYLGDLACLQWNAEPKDTQNCFWLPTIVFDKDLQVDMPKLLAIFKENNIDTRTFFYPLSSLPFLQKVESNVVAYDLCERAVNLPSYFELKEEQIKHVADCVRRFLGM